MNETRKFDVFLSHNGKEKPIVIDLGKRLRGRGVRVWLDAWELRPGLSWQEGILEGLSNSRSCAVIIGQAGYGGWHKREMEAALLQQGSEYPVIPVLIPGAPDRANIGAFLSLLTWVDFRRGLDDPEAMDRLIWGITGLRPNEAVGDDVSEAHIAQPVVAENARFHIDNPKNGDLLVGPSIFAGTGPPKEQVWLHLRAPEWDEFDLGASSETDESGHWGMLGPQSWFERDLEAGPYEIYAAGVQDRKPSQIVTIYYRDSTNINRVARTIRRRFNMVEVSYELNTAFIETTKLRKGRLILADRVAGRVENIESLATEAGEVVAAKLCGLANKDALQVKVSIDRSGRIHLEPNTAWASYYAFPVEKGSNWYGFPPGTDFQSLKGMRETQMAWRLLPRVGQIPSKPFGDDFEATSTYLEIRHDGYRPEFLPLSGAEPQAINVKLSPVLHKRIAVLDFPSLDPESQIAGFSQLIAREMISAIERQPALAPFGYFPDSPPNLEEPVDFFEQMGRPPIEIANEVLTLHDVQAVQEQLESVDTRMVSGEGRYLQRKALDIQFLVRGSYRLFKQTIG